MYDRRTSLLCSGYINIISVGPVEGKVGQGRNHVFFGRDAGQSDLVLNPSGRAALLKEPIRTRNAGWRFPLRDDPSSMTTELRTRLSRGSGIQRLMMIPPHDHLVILGPLNSYLCIQRPIDQLVQQTVTTPPTQPYLMLASLSRLMAILRN